MEHSYESQGMKVRTMIHAPRRSMTRGTTPPRTPVAHPARRFLTAASLLTVLGGVGWSSPAELRGAEPSHPSATEASGRSLLPTAAPLADRLDPGMVAFRAELAGMVNRTPWRSAQWGILAVSLTHGDTLFALNPTSSLAPASNQKLFTTAAALHVLGPDYRFPTFLLTDGEVVDGVLHGDLILYGTGDPAISDRLLPSRDAAFREFGRELRALGIRRIEGRVLGDGTFFHGATRDDSWNPLDLNDWFTAPVSALSYNENVFSVRIQPGIPGAPPRILTFPEGVTFPLVNQAQTTGGAPSSPLILVRDHPDDPVSIRGGIRTGSREVWRQLTHHNPAEMAAEALRQALGAEGIQIRGGSGAVGERDASQVTGARMLAPAFPSASGSPSRPLRTLAVHYSPPLPEILEVVNKASHNLYAEALLFAMGKMWGGDASFEGGRAVLGRFLSTRVGVPAERFVIRDGSGLSRLNRTTAEDLVTLLRYMHESEHRDLFLTSLPEAGNRRELSRMFRTPAASNLRAKTGTIHRVSALSGVVRSQEGEPILFSIMVNDVPSPWAAKRVEDQIGAELAAFRRPSGGPDPIRPGSSPFPMSATGTEDAPNR